MDIFWKAIGGSLIGLVFSLILKKRNGDVALALDLLVCSLLLTVALSFLSPLMDFLRQLATLGELDNESLRILVKATALGTVGQLAGMLCADAGNSALGKGIEIASVCAILWISLPLMSGLLELIQTMIGQI